MSVPRPILRDQPSAKVRQLLASAHLDVPPEDGRERTLAALGLTGGLLTATLVTKTMANASNGANPMPRGAACRGAGAAFATRQGATGLVERLGVTRLGTSAAIATALMGGILATVLLLRSHHRSEAIGLPQPFIVAEANRPPAQAPAAVPLIAPALAPAPDGPPRTAAPGRTSRPGRRTPAKAAMPSERVLPAADTTDLPSSRNAASPPASALPPPVPPAPRQLRDYEALARARRALDVPPDALALLDAFHRDFSQTRLAPEAAVLRIQALVADGQTAEACRKGQHFLATYPNITLATTVQALLEGVCTLRPKAPSSSDSN